MLGRNAHGVDDVHDLSVGVAVIPEPFLLIHFAEENRVSVGFNDRKLNDINESVWRKIWYHRLGTGEQILSGDKFGLKANQSFWRPQKTRESETRG